MKETTYREPVAVFITSRQDELALAKSMLMSADIPFVAQGEHLGGKFQFNMLGYYDAVTNGMALLVAPDDAFEARAVLADLRTDIVTHTTKHGHTRNWAQKLARVAAIIILLGFALFMLSDVIFAIFQELHP